ncbi:MAG: recombinase family protein [Pseudomonadota bacterium]
MKGTAPAIRAAQYVRMSTDRQDFSVEMQEAANLQYALARNYQVVARYADLGISGVTVAGREGLKRLLADVVGGVTDFTVILVYDVSRWGRFQDPDQAAHYEFLCREAGVAVEYSSEAFLNDHSLLSSMMKSLKRVMAAEYSRELAIKVSRGQRGLAQQGYWQGGPPGYGLRRRVVKKDGSMGRQLEYGEHKGPNGERTTLIPGPPEEVAIVRQIYREFVREHRSYTGIARLLNENSVAAEFGRDWSFTRVKQVLTNEKYVGVMVLGKRTRPLGGAWSSHPRCDWIRTEGAFSPLVSRTLFNAAEARRKRRNQRKSDEELLDHLRELLARDGTVTLKAIWAAKKFDPHLYGRFGSIMKAYELIGYQPTSHQKNSVPHKPRSGADRSPRWSDAEATSELRMLLQQNGRLTSAIVNQALGAHAFRNLARQFGSPRRLYALAGYKPSARQEVFLQRNPNETLTISAADILRLNSSRSPQNRNDSVGPQSSAERAAQGGL